MRAQGTRPFSQMAHSTCDQCGSPLKASALRRQKGGLALLQAAVSLGLADINGLDVWVCTRCDNTGVMGPTEGE